MADYLKASREDTQDYRARDPDDYKSLFMWDHTREAHNGTINNKETDYTFKVLTRHRDPLERLLTEATRIKQSLGARTITDNNDKEMSLSNSFNRKHQFFCPR